MNKQRFSYDEMVMATDGTRYYIKFLDDKPASNGNGTTTASGTIPSTVRSTTSQIGRTTIYRNIEPASSVQIRKTVSSPSVMPIFSRPEPIVDQNGHLVCHICKKTFKHRGSLQFHMQKFHRPALELGGGDLKDCECPCGKKFMNKKFMRRHQKQVYNGTGRTCGPTVLAEDMAKVNDEGDIIGKSNTVFLCIVNV